MLTPVTPNVPPTVVFPDIVAVLEAVKAPVIVAAAEAVKAPPDVNTSVVTVPVKVGPALGAKALVSIAPTVSSTYFFVEA